MQTFVMEVWAISVPLFTVRVTETFELQQIHRDIVKVGRTVA